jgi:hypothetical protein
MKPAKNNNKYRAQRAMWAGACFTLLGLLIIPLSVPSMLLKYSQETGFVGDTIGGIAGPILNFTGLLMVYYSLREQFKANRQQAKQIKSEVDRSRSERYFDLTFKLVEKLTDVVEKQEEVFINLPLLNFNHDKGDTFTPNPQKNAWQTNYATDLRKYWWIFNDFQQYFTLIKNQLQGPELDGQQKMMLINLIDVTYGRKLATSRIGYQENYKNMFEYREDMKDTRPDLLKVIDDQLAEIRLLNTDAEGQIATERIPFGDTE